MSISKLKSYLIRHHVSYETARRDPSQNGAPIARTVIVRVDGELAMVVLPLNEEVDFSAVSAAADGASVRLADESEIRERIPDCDPATVPPLGHLFDMLIFLSPRIAEREELSFCAGSRLELITMGFDDFERLAGMAMIKLVV